MLMTYPTKERQSAQTPTASQAPSTSPAPAPAPPRPLPGGQLQSRARRSTDNKSPSQGVCGPSRFCVHGYTQKTMCYIVKSLEICILLCSSFLITKIFEFTTLIRATFSKCKSGSGPKFHCLPPLPLWFFEQLHEGHEGSPTRWTPCGCGCLPLAESCCVFKMEIASFSLSVPNVFSPSLLLARRRFCFTFVC